MSRLTIQILPLLLLPPLLPLPLLLLPPLLPLIALLPLFPLFHLIKMIKFHLSLIKKIIPLHLVKIN